MTSPDRKSGSSFVGANLTDVKHVEKDRKFVLTIDGSSDPAIVEYSVIRQGVIDLHHTEVPTEFQGKGIAQILARAAFEYVKENNLRMKLSCSYLEDYLKRHPNPEYEALVVKD